MTDNLKRVIDFIDTTNLYYIATMDEYNQPRVRPFGTAMVYKDKLYFMTGKEKKVSDQITKNNKVEICVFRDGNWMRIAGEVFDDETREAKVAMLEKIPILRNMYNEDDGKMRLLYFNKAKVSCGSLYEAFEDFEI